MQNGYYQATGGMVTQFNRLEVITNNLPNVNTSGFKRDDVVIGDFKRVYREVQDILPIENHTRAASRFVNSSIDRVPQVSQTFTHFGTGVIKTTENPLDLAMVRDDTFYLVRTKDGEIRLTKDGNFQLNDDGVLVNKQGYQVLSSAYFDNPEADAILVPEGSVFINVDRDGNIQADNNPIARLFIAQVDDIRFLEKDGDNTYRINDLTKIRDLDSSNAVRQGFTQLSNVNPVVEMTSLIETHRMLEMYQKVMTSHMDDLNQEAINKLASINA